MPFVEASATPLIDPLPKIRRRFVTMALTILILINTEPKTKKLI
jgi:hypothetical protein